MDQLQMAGLALGLEEGHRRLSVFGLMGTLNSRAGVIIFVLLLVYLVILEIGFETLELWAKENDVNGLVEKLKEELMMMGILSFTIFIYTEVSGGAVGTTSKVYNYYLAFELTHVILFFVSISFIFQASYLISYAVSQGRSYLKSKRILATELVTALSDMQKERPFDYWCFHHIPWWAPVQYPRERNRVEVKIVERIFLEYQRRSEDFRFAHYISKLFQAYISELGKVSTRSWLVIAVLVVLNYCRIVALDSTWNKMSACYKKIEGETDLTEETTSSHRRLGGDGGKPTLVCAIYLYGYALFIAWMVPVFCGAVLVFAKYYKTKLIDLGFSMLGVAITGQSSRQNYVDALVELQKIEEVASRQVEALRISKKNAPSHGTSHGHGGHGGHGHGQKHGHHEETNHTIFKDVAGTIAVEVENSTVDAELQTLKDIMKARFEKNFETDVQARSERRLLPWLHDILFPKSFGYPNAILPQLFWFDSPFLFFHHVELCLLFQSMYVSVWATQLVPLTVHYPGWAVALTIPMICNFFTVRLLLHDAVIIKAICEIHDNAIVETEEEEEMENTCIGKMRAKLEELYRQEKADKERNSSEPLLKHVWLEKEFMAFDLDDSGEISQNELQEFMSVSLQIKFSSRELKTLWLAIDEDLSGEVQWHEFYVAIFPDEKGVIKDEIAIVMRCQELVFTDMAAQGIDVAHVGQYLRGIFEKFDEDKSGSIDENEFSELIKKITGPEKAPTEKEMRSMFAAIDFDKGGGIDFVEFEKLLTPPKDKLPKILARQSSSLATTVKNSSSGDLVSKSDEPVRSGSPVANSPVPKEATV